MNHNSLTDLVPTRREVLKKGALTTGVVLGVGASAQPVAATEFCPRTPGFWKNPKNWEKVPHNPADDSPVVNNVGGMVVETKEEAIEILSEPPKGDTRIIMAHHVLATKLNLHAGGFTQTRLDCLDDPWDNFDTVLQGANTWLYEAWKTDDTSWMAGGFDGEPYKDRLDAYNNNLLGCGCI